MSNTSRISSLIIMTVGLGACATPSTIKDTTGYHSPEIVRKVRCEARQAIADKIAAWLIDQKTDFYGVTISEKIRSRKIAISTIQWEKLDPGNFAYVQFFFQTAVAYNFTLNITEKNDASVDLNFLTAITKGALSVPVKTGLNRTRNNTQAFTISDKWGFLVKDLPEYYCDPTGVKPGYFNTRPNLVYPLAGKIGVDYMIDDFVDLTLFGNLADKNGETKPAIAYSQEFTTTIFGNATPKISFTSSAALKDGTLGLSNSRTDKHKIVVGFSLEVGPEFDEEAKGEGSFVDVEGDATTKRAVSAIDKLIRRTEQVRFTPN